MAISVDYVLRETATNLKRNFLMTTAAILVVATSLGLVGAALMIRQGVSKATLQWRGGVELNIFLNPDVAETQRDAILQELNSRPDVRKVTFVDQEAAYDEFKTMFEASPDMVESVSPQDLPPSFRVVPRQPEFTETIGEQFNGREGVKEVVYAKETVDTLIRFTRYLQVGMGGVAAVMLIAALLLILLTIRMAIFARRREVAVMKLVGATNWFIRVPFMLEGMVQGLVGATGAFVVLAVLRKFLESAIEGNTLIEQFVVSSSDIFGTGMFILFMGAVVGAVGSAVAVSRFLDV